MTKRKISDFIDTEIRIVYHLNGIIFVPHRKIDVYVSPGYPRHNRLEWTSSKLKELGAKEQTLPMWARNS